MMNINIKERRESVGRTQLQMAHDADISLRAYQKFESREQVPRADTAYRIAKALGTTVEAVWGQGR